MKKSILFICIFPIALLAQIKEGFFNYEWMPDKGLIALEVPKSFVGHQFLYVPSLATGIGSNDIGLDRGQLSSEKVVYFYKSGTKLLLIHDNLEFRALSNNTYEKTAVAEAFALSVLHGFNIIETNNDSYKINFTDFLLQDAHQVAQKLKDKDQGTYKLNKNKSAIYHEHLYNFPDNSEFEALLTFEGEPKGSFIKEVSPSPQYISVRQHHSFIRLPKNYSPREFHPESGYFFTSFVDYASPINQDKEIKYINRHRLEKVNPGEISEVVKPIIYYLDPGCPEPIKSALLEGASWWNQAFEAAGYLNAFQVKILPNDAHPLDVRYNMIQWVHRKTRGWSYGSSITDPRTGEILKGHVSLGSLRVRQDYLIAKGIIGNYDLESEDPRMLQLALDRLKQLSAHEIGHTLGLAHNFAASTNDRASVMDYPHPYIIQEGNNLNTSKAYDDKIGIWDKRAIVYGYAECPPEINEDDFLNEVLQENKRLKLLYITDKDARPNGGLHPQAHLWDNGKNPTEELNRLIRLRKTVLENLGTQQIKNNQPYSEIEKVLVPAYLMHRYQIEAAVKLIGGYNYDYATKPSDLILEEVSIEVQQEALQSIFKTLEISFLEIPTKLLQIIPPPAYGFPRTRESFKGTMGELFDPIAAAEASVNHTLTLLLTKERLARLSNSKNNDWNLEQVLNLLHQKVKAKDTDPLSLMLEKAYFIKILSVLQDKNLNKQVAATLDFHLSKLISYDKTQKLDLSMNAHKAYLRQLLNTRNERPELFKIPKLNIMPPGSPIGCH